MDLEPHPLDAPVEPRIDAAARRLDAVRRLGLIGSDRDVHLDRLTRVAANALEAECAYLTVLDDEEQWIQSCSLPGHDRRTSLSFSFCETAIREQEHILVVPDALTDPRFADFPNVVADGGIRFYAGRVVRSPGGYAIGTLCVTDSEPRQLDGRELVLLDDLGAMVEQELERIEHLRVLREVDASERMKHLVLETLSEGVVLHDAHCHIVECNAAAERLLGMTSGDLKGRSLADPELETIHESGEPWPLEERPAPRALRTGATILNEGMGFRRRDGATVWLRVNAHPTRRSDGSINGVVVAFDDITAERQLLRDLSRFQFLFEHANDMITVVDGAGQVQYTSPSTGRVLGYPDGWHHPRGVLGIVHPEDLPIATRELDALRRSERGPEPFVVRVRGNDGEWRHIECVGVNLLEEPAVQGIVLTSRDATERVELADELAHLAAHDELTGLPNRRTLEASLEHALDRARHDGSRVGLCFIDLDGFKGINDTLGHGAGDQLLVDAAAQIAAAVRRGDVAARVGGDEFVVLLQPVESDQDARWVAERVHEAVLRCEVDGDPSVRFGASLGLAVSTTADTPNTLMRRADDALYEAKRAGRSELRVAAPERDPSHR